LRKKGKRTRGQDTEMGRGQRPFQEVPDSSGGTSKKGGMPKEDERKRFRKRKRTDASS